MLSGSAPSPYRGKEKKEGSPSQDLYGNGLKPLDCC